METIKMWWGWLISFESIKNLSSFFEVAFMAATVPLVPICLGVPVQVAYASVAVFLIIVAIVNV